MRNLAITIAVLSLGSVAAQCPFQTVVSQPLGSGCNDGFIGCCAALPITPTFLPTLDIANCELDVFVPAIEGCCGVTVPFRALVLGMQQALVPLPEFGVGCELHVVPTVLLATSADTFSLPLPATLPPLTVMMQAAYLSRWTQGAGTISTFVLTDARAVTLQ